MKSYLDPVPNKTQQTLGLCYLAFQWLLLPSLVTGLFGSRLDAVGLNCLVFGVNFLAVTGLLGKFLLDSLKAFCRQWGRSLATVPAAFGLYWCGNMLMSLVLYSLDPHFSNVNDGSISQMAARAPGLMFLCAVFLVPVTEELLYRGLLFGRLYNRRPAAAWVVSAGLFALVHVAGYAFVHPPRTLALCFLQYLPAGAALAWAWVRSGNLIPSVLLHMLINAIGMLAMR